MNLSILISLALTTQLEASSLMVCLLSSLLTPHPYSPPPLSSSPPPSLDPPGTETLRRLGYRLELRGARRMWSACTYLPWWCESIPCRGCPPCRGGGGQRGWGRGDQPGQSLRHCLGGSGCCVGGHPHTCPTLLAMSNCETQHALLWGLPICHAMQYRAAQSCHDNSICNAA